MDIITGVYAVFERIISQCNTSTANRVSLVSEPIQIVTSHCALTSAISPWDSVFFHRFCVVLGLQTQWWVSVRLRNTCVCCSDSETSPSASGLCDFCSRGFDAGELSGLLWQTVITCRLLAARIRRRDRHRQFPAPSGTESGQRYQRFNARIVSSKTSDCTVSGDLELTWYQVRRLRIGDQLVAELARNRPARSSPGAFPDQARSAGGNRREVRCVTYIIATLTPGCYSAGGATSPGS